MTVTVDGSGLLQLTELGNQAETQAGNYFVSNYPPYGVWSADNRQDALDSLAQPPRPDAPLGVYLHIPFCRKRCHFCYFRVYTDKNSREIRGYLDAAIQEMEIYARQPFVGGRKPHFIYFGGGTPSYLSVKQLTYITDAMKRLFPWDEAQEIAFEAEPGTLTEPKLHAIREIGVTRLSFGVEHFDDRILKLNGRAHGSEEIDRAYGWAREAGFPQINIDLIAGMMGDTWETWRDTVRKAIAMDPDCVTIYQMEIPYNTTIYREMQEAGAQTAPVASWGAKREWVDYAFREMEAAGYSVTSAYTAVKDPERVRFIYRDALWTGADLMGLGVASFSHVNGVHYQNEHNWGPYLERLEGGELPIFRAYTPTEEEQLIRELILQFKLGHVRCGYFREKFGVEIAEHFAEALGRITEAGYLQKEGDELRLNRDGLLQADRLVHEFFLPQHRDARYA